MATKNGLKEIREAVFRRVDWSPDTSTVAADRLDEFVNESLQQFTLECPFLFFEERLRFSTQEDFSSEDDTDTLTVLDEDTVAASTLTNAWVLRRTIPVGTAGYTAWARDRSWDGRVIELTDEDGVVHTNRIRSVWSEELADEEEYYCVSLWTPWPYAEYGDVTSYRIYTPDYYLPDDVVEVKSMRVVGQSFPTPIKIIGQQEAESVGITDESVDRSGATPYIAYRRGHFALPTPNTAPDIEASSSNWSGPEPAGEFEYCFTLCWGKRDIDHGSPGFPRHNFQSPQASDESDGTMTATDPGAHRLREPLWESAPSPISDAYVQTNVNGEGAATAGIRVVLPDIEYALGFLLDGLTTGSSAMTRVHSTHSGWYYRVYRRRLTADFTDYTDLGTAIAGTSITTLEKLDIQDAFFLLAEVNHRGAGGLLEVNDLGQWIPDYNRRLRDVSGYQAIRFHPPPDARYEIECRVIRRPQRLVSDSDVPPIHSEAIKVLVDHTCALMYEQLGNFQMMQSSMEKYARGLAVLKKRYGDLRPGSEPIRKKPSRVRRATSAKLNWWRTSD